MYYSFASLEREGLTHAIFTRCGGVSPAPWHHLNVGGTVGDERERVIENRRRSFEAAGLPFDSIADLWQVHSADAFRADAPKGDLPYLARADALITDRPGVSLFMRFADCVPILLYDPARLALGDTFTAMAAPYCEPRNLKVRMAGLSTEERQQELLQHLIDHGQ